MLKIACVLNLTEACRETFRDRVFILRLHSPKGNISARAAVSVGHIEYISQLVRNISVHQKGNSLSALVNPSTEPVPCVNFGTRRSLRLLRVNEKLLLKTVFVVVCRRYKKIRITLGIGGDIRRGNGRHLRYELVFARHG